jgi:3'-phosphoadenosine 5'-phosphosulfate sulfotransferase (PAPS reductase)/FAD synthetase
MSTEFDFSKFKKYTPSGSRERVEVMNLSGGRSSATVLMMLINGGFGKQGDMAIFENTGKEHESCYLFLKRLSQVTNVPIVWLEYCLTEKFIEELVWSNFSYEKFNRGEYSTIGEILNIKKLLSYDFKKSPNNFWYKDGFSNSTKNFKIVNFETANRIGKPFTDVFIYKCAIRIMKREGLVLPNAGQRWCTGDMKEKTSQNYMRSLGVEKYTSYVGMRVDEPRRVNRVFIRNNNQDKIWYDCPGHWGGITKDDVGSAWQNQPFDLGREGNEKNCFNDFMGNCDFCHLKSKIKKLYLIQNGVLPSFWQQIERIAYNYNNERDCMSRSHGTYDEMVLEAKSMPIITKNQVLTDREVEIDCFGCGE